MQMIFSAKWQKNSPRKIRIIVDEIRGLNVMKAKEKLSILAKRATTPVMHLLVSAISAAKDNDLEEKSLYIKEIYCNEGPKLKRRMYRARGRASTFCKRMSHITLVLADKKSIKQENKGLKKQRYKLKNLKTKEQKNDKAKK